MELKEYISLEDFSKICGISIKQIKKRYQEIPGIIYIDNSFKVLIGTKYPYSMRGIKKQSLDKNNRKYNILKAVSQSKYIDGKMLGLYDYQFSEYVIELCLEGLIKYNEACPNKYAANSFELTSEGELFLNKIKQNKIINFTNYTTDIISKTLSNVIIDTIR